MTELCARDAQGLDSYIVLSPSSMNGGWDRNLITTNYK